ADRFRQCQADGLPGIPRAELLVHITAVADQLDALLLRTYIPHLNVKPETLLLDSTGVRVAPTSSTGITPRYAAPETFDGAVSQYCDQYSLAIVYQELLTGHPPFAGTNVHQLIMQHLTGTPNLSPLPESDRAAVGRALSKQPEDRFPTCGDFVRALVQLP